MAGAFARRFALAASLIVLAGASAGQAMAQAVERNLPPAPQAAAPVIVAPNAVPADQDDRPIGPALSGLLILGPQDAVRTEPVQGVDTTLAPRLGGPKARAELAHFLGRPLSKKLIAEIEAAIARLYRDQGFPFVSLSTPPQVIGGGVLQVRVIEFHAARIGVTGVTGRAADRVRRGVRLEPGQPVDSEQLEADLDWLNRYPYRNVQAVFSPGASLGDTNLDLVVAPSKPWQVYGGYANSGTPSTGWDRYFIGAQVGGLLGADSLLSYQFTGSPDAFGESHPLYLSHGLRFSEPTGARQDVELTFDHVESNETVDPFTVRQITDEVTAGYRTSLSNFSRLPGDVLGGVEFKTQSRDTFFDGVNVLGNRMDVYQAYLGWADEWSDASGHNQLSYTVHVSPGGFGGQASDAALGAFSNDRVTRALYAYLSATFSRTTRLPGRWTVNNSLTGQVATGPLPDTEQTGLGGSDLVRGYTLDDGAFDDAIVSRNELRTPPLPLLQSYAPLAGALSPYAFLDGALGSSYRVKGTAHPASTGVGADYQMGGHLTASASAAYDLFNTLATRAGDWVVQGRINLSF